MAKDKSLYSFLFSFFVFITINLPSIKLFYSSSLINIIALLGILIVGFYRKRIILKEEIFLQRREFTTLFLFLSLWMLMLFVSWIQEPFLFDFTTLIQIFSIIGYTIGILVFMQKEDFSKVFFIQIIWGLFVAILEATITIPKDRALGQHYLTSGVPIALTVVMIIGYIYQHKSRGKVFLFYLPTLFILFAGLTSLEGRAPILFSLFTPLLIMFTDIVVQRDLRKKILRLALLLISSIIIFSIIIYILPESTLNRLSHVFFEIKDEPRYEVYANAFKVISENPMGAGLDYTEVLGRNYPHNIFLEIILIGGYFMLIPILFFFGSITETVFKTIKYKIPSIEWLSMFLYIFFTWNVSFTLYSTYILFALLAIYLRSITENLKSGKIQLI